MTTHPESSGNTTTSSEPRQLAILAHPEGWQNVLFSSQRSCPDNVNWGVVTTALVCSTLSSEIVNEQGQALVAQLTWVRVRGEGPSALGTRCGRSAPLASRNGHRD